MAGMAENIQVVSSDKSAVFDGELSPTDLTFNLPVSDTSLQELIDSELALRIGSRADSEPEPDAEQEDEPDLPIIATTRVQPVKFLLEPDPSERFIQAERVHTMSTLNVFSDTIDLSPSEPTSPLFPRTPVDTSPQFENNPFVTPSPVTNLDSDESPVTEDASDLEPIPLFTQTITSDHEQSPLTEANPFLQEEVAVEELLEEKDSPSIPVEDVLVVVDPPDDPSPVNSPGPISPQEQGEYYIDEIESDISPIDMSDPPSVVVETETEPDFETQLNISQEVPEEQLLDFSNDAFSTHDESPRNTGLELNLGSPKQAIPEFTLNVDSPKPSETESPTTSPESKVDLESPESKVDLESPEAKVDLESPESKVDLESPKTKSGVPDEMPVPKQKSPSVSETKASVDTVDCSVVNVNSMREFSVANLPPSPSPRVLDDEWTTVEDAVKEVQSCEATEQFEPQPPDHLAEDIPPLHNNVSESISTTTTTKTVKKKKSTESADSTTTKTKKTKKTKKSEEKENHISVMTNGHDHDHHGENGLESPDVSTPTSPTSPVSPETKSPISPAPPVDDDELSNVCVRDLKQTYCREAAKSSCVSLKVPSEEPVPPTVPIRELRRSFCDLQKACESPQPDATLSPLRATTPSLTRSNSHSNQLKARSLGDLRRLTDSPQSRHIHTGVSVKALAASYWNLVSNEPTSPPIVLTPPPNRNVAHTLKKSSFSKFDQLQKKSVLHVRSSDASKIQKQFNQETPEAQGANPTCKACNKTVFVMEQIKAERSVWHKNCFRCKECSKQLTVDIYQSHEGELYCKPHFKELFKPKAVLENTDEEPLRRRKPEMIIRENQPVELPPDVVRASDKADLGLEELSALNVKSRFQVFEKTTSDSSEVERSPSTVNVKRSPSILSKLAKFQKKGMDVGVTDDTLNGVDYEESSSSEDEAQGEDGQVVKASKMPEKPISFNKMEDVKRSWETSSGSQKTKEELRAEHKKEISQIRSRLFQGKQGKMKEAYEQAVAESEGKVTTKKDPDIVASEKARLLKERFERGEVIHSDSEEDEEKKAKNKDVEEDMSVFEAGISKKSRSIFLELDATAAKTQTSPVTPPVHALTPRITERRASQTVSRQVSEDIVRATDSTEDVVVPTADISNKFKFFETYKPPEKERKSFRITPPREGQVKVKPAKTPLHRCVICLANNAYASDLSEESPDREVYRDPSVVRSEDATEDETIVKRSQTASRMLSLFRQMEEQKEAVPDGPKPLKCFTPPPDYKEDQSGSASSEEEEESEEEAESEDDGIVRASDKIEDEFLKQAQNAARAKTLKEKFEHWEPEKQSVNNAINLLDSEQESIESTKSLRARFESLKAEADQPKEKPRPKVNRFVLQEATAVNKCVSCDKTAYPLEKIEVDGKVYHANCFRCQQCHCKLRMETYTLNNDNLYCLPHFRQLFISKGNYDEGFGSNQHKRKWESQATAVPTSPTAAATVNGH